MKPAMSGIAGIDWSKHPTKALINTVRRSSTVHLPSRKGVLCMPVQLINVGQVVGDALETQQLCGPGGKAEITVRPNYFKVEILPDVSSEPPAKRPKTDLNSKNDPKASSLDSVPILEPADSSQDDFPAALGPPSHFPAGSAVVPGAMPSGSHGACPGNYATIVTMCDTHGYASELQTSDLSTIDFSAGGDYRDWEGTQASATGPMPSGSGGFMWDVPKLQQLKGLTKNDLNSKFDDNQIRDIMKFNRITLALTKSVNCERLASVIESGYYY